MFENHEYYRSSISRRSVEFVRCFIVPPHILEQIAMRSSDQKQKELALGALALSEGARQRREIVGTIQSIFPAGTSRLQRTIFDCQNQTSVSNENPVRQEGADPATTDDKDTINEAYDYSGDTYNFYDKAYGRNSADDNGMPLNSYIHYDANFNNAYWDGTEMVYGDGDGTSFGRFTKSIDVIGHELTHGVTQFTAALSYSGESGALNESFSDVFGSMVKQFKLDQTADQADWLIGAELFTPNVNGKALRDMFNPGTAYDDQVLGKDPQPGHMNDYVKTTRDHGGVHINSGIPNKAFCITAKEIGGKAWEKAGQIWYATLTQKLTSSSGFQDCADSTFEEAGILFGANNTEQKAVSKGWTSVGITPRVRTSRELFAR